MEDIVESHESPLQQGYFYDQRAQQMTLGSRHPQNSASHPNRILKEVIYQDPSRAPEHSSIFIFEARRIINKIKMKEQDARTYLNSKKIGGKLWKNLTTTPLHHEEHGRKDPHSAPIILKTLLFAQIIFVPN